MIRLIYRNRLLAHLEASDRHLLEPLQPVELGWGQVLENTGKVISHVYFPETAVASIGRQRECLQPPIEVGLAGMEGMTGLPLLYGDNRSMTGTVVQVPGQAWRVSADRLREAIRASATLKSFLLKYARTRHDQLASTAIANAAGSIEQRLARWLLMCHDRITGNHIILSHDVLAHVLGARRASVTAAIHSLEGQRLIRSQRMDLEIRNRAALHTVCAKIYGDAEAEYERIMGFSLKARPQQEDDLSEPVERRDSRDRPSYA